MPLAIHSPTTYAGPAIRNESILRNAGALQSARGKSAVPSNWPNGQSTANIAPKTRVFFSVSGANSSFADYERLDLYYVDNWSILVDLAILARTVPVVLSSRGAY